MEFTCWNGEVVRVAFALDCHDREVIGWAATTGGISGEMIRDLTIGCVEAQFGAPRAAHAVQWLSDLLPVSPPVRVRVSSHCAPMGR